MARFYIKFDKNCYSSGEVVSGTVELLLEEEKGDRIITAKGISVTFFGSEVIQIEEEGLPKSKTTREFLDQLTVPLWGLPPDSDREETGTIPFGEYFWPIQFVLPDKLFPSSFIRLSKSSFGMVIYGAKATVHIPDGEDIETISEFEVKNVEYNHSPLVADRLNKPLQFSIIKNYSLLFRNQFVKLDVGVLPSVIASEDLLDVQVIVNNQSGMFVKEAVCKFVESTTIITDKEKKKTEKVHAISKTTGFHVLPKTKAAVPVELQLPPDLRQELDTGFIKRRYYVIVSLEMIDKGLRSSKSGPELRIHTPLIEMHASSGRSKNSQNETASEESSGTNIKVEELALPPPNCALRAEEGIKDAWLHVR